MPIANERSNDPAATHALRAPLNVTVRCPKLLLAADVVTDRNQRDVDKRKTLDRQAWHVRRGLRGQRGPARGHGGPLLDGFE